MQKRAQRRKRDVVGYMYFVVSSSLVTTWLLTLHWGLLLLKFQFSHLKNMDSNTFWLFRDHMVLQYHVW